MRKWVSEGLLSAEQETSILNYEQAEKKAVLGGYSLYGFLIVAAFCVGLGVIALIAANWPAISPLIKLLGYFLILICLGFAVLKMRDKSDLWFESLLILFMIFCLAGIGLIAQIYNMEGESHLAIFTWSAITLGVMLQARKSPALHIWIAGFYTACVLWGIQDLSNSLFFEITLLHFLFFLFCSLMKNKIKNVVPFIPARIGVFEDWTLITGLMSFIAFHTDLPSVSFAICTFLIWIGATLAHPVLGRQKSTMDIWMVCLYVTFMSWIFSAFEKEIAFKITLLHPVFFLLCLPILNNKKIRERVPTSLAQIKLFEWGAVLTGLVSLFALHFNLFKRGITALEFFIVAFLAVVSVTAVFLSGYKKIQKYPLYCILFLYFLFYILHEITKLNSLSLMIFSSLTLILFALLFASSKKKSLFTLFIIAVIIRVMFFYITVFKSLTLTGLILVIMGLLVASLIYMVKKNKDKLLQWIEKQE